MNILFTDEQYQRLIENGRKQLNLKGTGQEIDFVPVVKLFYPLSGATWLLTELDEDGTAFGLCDLGMGFPELGYVSLDEILEFEMYGFKIEVDMSFKADKTLSQYGEVAKVKRRIVA